MTPYSKLNAPPVGPLANSLCSALCLLCLVAGCNQGGQPAPWAAKAVRIAGDARYTTNNGAEWSLLEAGTILPEGSVVQTARSEKNYVDLILGDGPGQAGTRASSSGGDRDMVRLHEDTALGIDKRAAAATGAGLHTETQLDLRKGRITGRVKTLAAGSTYEIKYATGVAGLRESGLIYDMSRAQPLTGGPTNPPCVLSMRSGAAVLVHSPGGSITVIPAGFTFDDNSQVLAPLPEAMKKEISATVESMH